MDSLATLIPSFSGPEYRVRRFAHIINLVVKAILSQFAKAKKEDDEDEDENLDDGVVGDEEEIDKDEEDDDEIDPSVEASDQAVVDKIAREVESDLSSPSLTPDDVKLGRFTLYKLRTFGNS
ncbi:hypothetical protein LshimejAT787_0705930 [Lyophyllum shimeji]|uniref:Uncharacterized protein n=1 Tax=Lyophyllum shimeji TaxID=47721 RepID=A0A9P3PR63_LYOSH|nr:hypothetical protein LshimejAT787_0705930 [Lyophyllum shimeji]